MLAWILEEEIAVGTAVNPMPKTMKLVLVTLVAVAMSVLLTAAISLILDGVLTVKPLAIASTCAILVGTPISYFVLSQTERLEFAHSDLTAAHRELSSIHEQLESAHRALKYTSSHDAMTGLVNRATFLASLEHMRRTSGGGYLLMIDADRFKLINDTHGHDAGDRALVAIANSLRQTARGDDICARIGGEEFAVYLPGSDYRSAVACAERQRMAVAAQRIELANGKTIRVTVSIGCAPLSAGDTIDDLMRRADRLLYQAKTEGRNRTCVGGQLQGAA